MAYLRLINNRDCFSPWLLITHLKVLTFSAAKVDRLFYNTLHIAIIIIGNVFMLCFHLLCLLLSCPAPSFSCDDVILRD